MRCKIAKRAPHIGESVFQIANIGAELHCNFVNHIPSRDLGAKRFASGSAGGHKPRSSRLARAPYSIVQLRSGRRSMNRYEIAVLVGSLRRDSFNRKLANGLARLAPGEFHFRHCEIGDLPLYNQDDDGRQAEAVKRLKGEIAAAQGLLFVSPEYNRSVPGLLKNAIDHASRPYGQSVFAGKPSGIIGVSIGAIGTAIAQQHLRIILAYLDAPALGQPEAFIQNKDGLFEENGDIGPASRQFLQNWMDRYVAFVRSHAGR
jgi:chromate reductase, NAD(P)H dehydrogenase (quinone)